MAVIPILGWDITEVEPCFVEYIDEYFDNPVMLASLLVFVSKNIHPLLKTIPEPKLNRLVNALGDERIQITKGEYDAVKDKLDKTRQEMLKNILKFRSHSAYVYVIGPAGSNLEYHHIVEQCQIRRSGFDPRLIYTGANIVRLTREQHIEISAHYSKNLGAETEYKTVRNWLSDNKTFEFQWQYGKEKLLERGVPVP
jgi:post-segregation antitoxin (ccd killing protein)